MSLSRYFERLGAPLANVRWSWGAVRPDGTVVLRVWQDETLAIEGQRFVRLINRKAYEGEENLGFAERCQHVQRLAEGAEGYALFCIAAVPDARSRQIISYDERTLVRLGQVRLIDGDEWAELAERVPARVLAAQGRE